MANFSAVQSSHKYCALLIALLLVDLFVRILPAGTASSQSSADSEFTLQEVSVGYPTQPLARDPFFTAWQSGDGLDSSTGNGAEAEAEATEYSYTLLGISASPGDERRAMLSIKQGTVEPQIQSVAQGETVGDATVSSVLERSVILQSSSQGELRLQLFAVEQGNDKEHDGG